MAKTLSVSTIADMLDAYRNVVILDGIGQKNPDTGPTATTYSAFVTEEVAPVLDKVRTYFNNNWGTDAEPGKLFAGCKNDAEKLAKVPGLVLDNLARFEAPPKAEYPLNLAARNIIVRLFGDNPNIRAAIAKGPSTLAKTLSGEVERLIVSGSSEKYGAMFEAELAGIATAQGKRSRRGDGTTEAASTLEALPFDTVSETAAD